MADDSTGLRSRTALVGALIAGGVAIVVLVVLTAANIGSSTVRGVLAVILGVVVAQFYEQALA